MNWLGKQVIKLAISKTLKEGFMSNELTKIKKVINKLSQEKYFKLCMWIKDRAEELKSKCPTYKDVASQVSRDLGFVIVPQSFASAAEVTGITWENKGFIGAMSGAKKQKIRDMLTLATAIKNLQIDTGSVGQVFKDVEEMITRLTSKL